MGLGGGERRSGFPEEPARSQSAPECGGQGFLSQARQGWGLAREGRRRWPGRRNSFHFPAGCGEWVPGVREGRDQTCSVHPFMGLSEETEPGEGLVEAGTDLRLEMLQIMAFTVVYSEALIWIGG